MTKDEAIKVLEMVEAHGLANEAKAIAIESLATQYKEQTLCPDCEYCRTYYHGENRPFSYECSKLYLTSLNSDDYCSRAKRKE